MTIKLWIILAIALLAGAILIEAYLKRGRRSKPMHEKFDARTSTKPPLGMEATDIEGFNQANHLNDNLARYNGAPLIRENTQKITPPKTRTPEGHAKIFTSKKKTP